MMGSRELLANPPVTLRRVMDHLEDQDLDLSCDLQSEFELVDFSDLCYTRRTSLKTNSQISLCAAEDTCSKIRRAQVCKNSSIARATILP
jgi:hypothetical protein